MKITDEIHDKAERLKMLGEVFELAAAQDRESGIFDDMIDDKEPPSSLLLEIAASLRELEEDISGFKNALLEKLVRTDRQPLEIARALGVHRNTVMLRRKAAREAGERILAQISEHTKP